MTDTDCKEDEVLKRMLKTPPKPHEPTTPLGKARRNAVDASVPHIDGKPIRSDAEASPNHQAGIQTTRYQR